MEANYLTILYWFCHTSTWICHGCTRVPHLEPHSHLPPCTIPPGHPSASAPRILYQTWTGESFLIWYYTCFHDIPPNHPILSLSHRVQKTVLYSFAVSHTGLSLPSLIKISTWPFWGIFHPWPFLHSYKNKMAIIGNFPFLISLSSKSLSQRHKPWQFIQACLIPTINSTVCVHTQSL